MFKKLFIVSAIIFGLVVFLTVTRSQAEKDALPASQEAAPVPVAEDEGAIVEEKTDDDPNADNLYAQVELFSYALTTIQSEYVDAKKPKEIIYGALTGMLAGLDPHSQFLPPEDYKDLKTETEGKFGGLGIEISARDGLLTVVTPIEDTPAWKVGLKAGDRIVKIEKEITKEMTLSEAVKKLRGAPGTSIHITILRESEFKLHEFDIVREIIHIQDVKEPHIIGDNIGYVRLVEFREDSYTQFYKALKDLKDQGATALILDLRNNPGGLLNVAIDISEIFLPEGQVIVSTKGRHSDQNIESISRNKKNEFSDWPIVAMINEGSASGSEILAGALKDNKRAVTLGSKSFGKGSVQSVIPLPDGSGLRLTTAKYFTPSGVCIHEVGITPDIVVERLYPKDVEADDADVIDEAALVAKRDPDGKKDSNSKKDLSKVFDKVAEEAVDADPNKIEKDRREAEMKKRMAEDNQIQSAISVIKGIRVYQTLQK